MFRLAALNQEGEESSAAERSTKEAQEAKAFDLYNEALRLQQQNEHEDAVSVYEELLKTALVEEAARTCVNEYGEAKEHPLKHPGLILKYSTHKNVANIAAEKEDMQTAIEHYLQAVMLDTSDVTLWYKIGNIAMNMFKLPLARFAFTQGLECNANHWPCLNLLISVLYATMDYEYCLLWISKAFEKEPAFPKGIALMKAMYRECPHLKQDTKRMFEKLHDFQWQSFISPSDCRQYVDEALHYRIEQRKLAVRPRPPDIELKSKTPVSWLNFGKLLIETYDHVMNDEENESSISSKVVLPNLNEEDSENNYGHTAEQLPSQSINKSEEFALDTNFNLEELNLEIEQHWDILDRDSVQDFGDFKQQESDIANLNDVEMEIVDIENYGDEITTRHEDEEVVDNNDVNVEVKKIMEDLLIDIDCKLICEDMVCDIITKGIQETSSTGNQEELHCVKEEIACTETIKTQDQLSNTEIKYESRRTSNCESREHNVENVGEIVQEILNDICGKLEQNENDEKSPKFADLSQNSILLSQSSFDESMVRSQDSSSSIFQKPKKTKRKRQVLDGLFLDDIQLKRRSARVRKPTGKKEKIVEPVNIENETPSNDFRQTLLSYLPGSLLNSSTSDNISAFDSDSQDSQDSCDTSQSTTLNRSTESINKLCNEIDPTTIKEFIEKNKINCGLIDVMHKYCEYLAALVHVKWPTGTRGALSNTFKRCQEHMSYPPVTEDGLPDDYKGRLILCMLSGIEAIVDVEMDFIENSLISKRKNYSNRHFCDCMFEITLALNFPSIFPTENHAAYTYDGFCMRYHWLRSHHFTLQKKYNAAIEEIIQCIEQMETMEKENGNKVEICLCNLKNDKVISIENAQLRIDSFKKKDTIDHVKHIINSKNYKEVKNEIKKILKIEPTQTFILSPVSLNMENLHEKYQLLEILFDASTKDPNEEEQMFYSGYIVCECEFVVRCVNLMLEKVKAAQSEQIHDSSKSEVKSVLKQWQTLLWQAIRFVDALFNDTNSYSLPPYLLSIVTKALVAINLDTLQNTRSIYDAESKANRFISWILLYRIVKKSEKQNINVDQDFHGSLSILSMAHETFGNKAICCSRNGRLLKFYTTVLFEEYTASEASDVYSSAAIQQISEELEQNFFCMFGYPTKIPKNSLVVDHSSKQMSMTWANSCVLYQYFAPKELPSYDSYKATSLLSDFANLLIRITKLIPEDVKSAFPCSIQNIKEYLNTGKTDCLGQKTTDLNVALEFQTKDIYYLLADYYFKNKEMVKAITYYIFDLSANPTRFDSWASIALAKASQVDIKMRSCEEKKKSVIKSPEDEIMTEAEAALHCFSRALAIDENSATLWIEYGTLAYCLHSYNSRLLRSISAKEDADAKYVKDLKEKQMSMLDLSQSSFESALKCEVEDANNEEWLIRYMLGKIAEKKRRPHEEYLKHYTRSLTLLHLKHAKYPKKIQFKSYQCDYAIEALEVYYRIHACILKIVHHEINLLENYKPQIPSMSSVVYKTPLSEVDFSFFYDILDECAESAFVRREGMPQSQLSDTKSTSSQSSSKPSPCKLLSTPSTALSMGSLVPDVMIDSISKICDERKKSESSVDLTSSENTEEIEIMETNDSVTQKPVVVTPIKTFSTEEGVNRCAAIIKRCDDSLRLCLQRFPQHYKSLYRLAYLYIYSSEKRKHVSWSRDLILNSTEPWQKLDHMPAQGLLAEKNKTNLFNGVWKIPVDEIDRPGSFASHLQRSILLLLEILHNLKDHKQLLHMNVMLNKNPDAGRKYLRDSDRVKASKIALDYNIKIINSQVEKLKKSNTQMLENASKIMPNTLVTKEQTPSSLTQYYDKLIEQVLMYGGNNLASFPFASPMATAFSGVTSSPAQSKRTKESLEILLDAHTTYKQVLKLKKTELPKQLLINAYKAHVGNTTELQFLDTNKLVEKAIQFCQQQLANKKMQNSATWSNTSAKLTDKVSLSDNSGSSSSQKTSPVMSKPNMVTVASATTEVDTLTMKEKGEVKLVMSGAQTYTKVITHKTDRFSLPSSISTSPITEEIPLKRRKEDLDGNKGLTTTKPSLNRSLSMPTNQERNEVSNVVKIKHRKLSRTMSVVSDATKQKLKSAILLKKSAALVRKPSITAQEIIEISNDSSQSEEDDGVFEEEMDCKIESTQNKQFSIPAQEIIQFNTPFTSS